MSTVEQSVDVEVPVRTAYVQRSRSEEFPTFMRGAAFGAWRAEVEPSES